MNLKNILGIINTNKLIDCNIIRMLSENRNYFKMYLVSSGLDLYDFLDQINKTRAISTSPDQDATLIEIFHIFN
jgi:hypothetical protein